MKSDITKIMMNPIRIKILQELGLKGKATTKEIQSACGDIAQATLYRHLNELLKNDIIQVIDENIINGIIEKVYTINLNPTLEIAKDPSKLSKGEYLDIFNQFIITFIVTLAMVSIHIYYVRKILKRIFIVRRGWQIAVNTFKSNYLILNFGFRA